MRRDERRRCPYDNGLELCRTCLVRRECLAYALERDDLIGIWGGTTADRRRRARARGLTVDKLLDELDAFEAAPEWSTPPCAGLRRLALAQGPRPRRRRVLGLPGSVSGSP